MNFQMHVYSDSRKTNGLNGMITTAYLHQYNVELINIQPLLSKDNLIAWELVECQKLIARMHE